MKQKIKIGEECLFDIYQRSNLAVTTARVVPIKKLKDSYEVISLETNEIFESPKELLTPYKKGEDNIVYRCITGEFDIDIDDMLAMVSTIGILEAYGTFMYERADMNKDENISAMKDLIKTHDKLDGLFEKLMRSVQSKVFIKTLNSKVIKKPYCKNNNYLSSTKTMLENVINIIKSAFINNTITDIEDIDKLDGLTDFFNNILYPNLLKHFDNTIRNAKNFDFENFINSKYRMLRNNYSEMSESKLSNIKLLIFYKVKDEDKVDYFIIDGIDSIINGVTLTQEDFNQYIDDSVDDRCRFYLNVIDLNTLEGDNDAK